MVLSSDSESCNGHDAPRRAERWDRAGKNAPSHLSLKLGTSDPLEGMQLEDSCMSPNNTNRALLLPHEGLCNGLPEISELNESEEGFIRDILNPFFNEPATGVQNDDASHGIEFGSNVVVGATNHETNENKSLANDIAPSTVAATATETVEEVDLPPFVHDSIDNQEHGDCISYTNSFPTNPNQESRILELEAELADLKSNMAAMEARLRQNGGGRDLALRNSDGTSDIDFSGEGYDEKEVEKQGVPNPRDSVPKEAKKGKVGAKNSRTRGSKRSILTKEERSILRKKNEDSSETSHGREDKKWLPWYARHQASAEAEWPRLNEDQKQCFIAHCRQSISKAKEAGTMKPSAEKRMRLILDQGNFSTKEEVIDGLMLCTVQAKYKGRKQEYTPTHCPVCKAADKMELISTGHNCPYCIYCFYKSGHKKEAVLMKDCNDEHNEVKPSSN